MYERVHVCLCVRACALASFIVRTSRFKFGVPVLRYLEGSDKLHMQLKQRKLSCMQATRSFPELYTHGAKLKAKYDDFVRLIAEKTGAVARSAPLKGAWRAIEKMVLRPSHVPGGELNASSCCDCLRSSLICKDFTVVNSVVELLEWLDQELGDEAYTDGIDSEFRICLVRTKCRFSTPTSGGWADLLTNFSFVDDSSKHVIELQVEWTGCPVSSSLLHVLNMPAGTARTMVNTRYSTRRFCECVRRAMRMRSTMPSARPLRFSRRLVNQ